MHYLVVSSQGFFLQRLISKGLLVKDYQQRIAGFGKGLLAKDYWQRITDKGLAENLKQILAIYS